MVALFKTMKTVAAAKVNAQLNLLYYVLFKKSNPSYTW